MVNEGKKFSSFGKLAVALGPMMRESMPFGRTEQAIVHRLRKERDEEQAKRSKSAVKMESPKPAPKKRPVSTISSSSDSRPWKDNKRKRSCLSELLEIDVAGVFPDPKDKNKHKAYTGIEVINVLLVLI